MSDEVLSNIDIDLSGVNIGQPVIDNQTPLCRTGEVKVVATNSGLKRLVIPLVLEEPVTATSGRELQPGFQTTVGFLIEPTGGLTKERIAEELKKFKAAVLKLSPTDPALNGPFGDVAQFRGQLVRPKLVAQRNDPSKQDCKAWLKA